MKSAPQFLAAFALTGWGTLTTPSDGRALRAAIRDDTLVLSNPGSRDAFYRVIEEEAAALARRAPSVDSAGYGCLLQRSSTAIDLDSVPGYQPGRSRALHVYWWYRGPDHAGTSADRIRTLHVRL